MDLPQIKKQLPIGADKEISKLTKISITSVRNVLNGLKTKPEIEFKVLEATTNFLKEYKDKKAIAIQELQAVANA
ncbi:hypothetical protein K5L04_10430 [Flavobacterium psychrophilum]|uniref:hypothetical protein n=1 Tax=Flavobacterium psychrophilum TaxID=96345 RepID=UPI001C8F4AC4|nr:hypothetical protein [Flavobacterium psychrophilum]QZL00109.1 hypothetical protein K5L04_10430 [Flavobacterium psychrophilum]